VANIQYKHLNKRRNCINCKHKSIDTYALSQHCFIISYTLGGHLAGLSRRLPLSINSIIWHPFIP